MADLKGTRTEKNLLKSFAGESQARNRYTYFASVAKKEGLVQISKIFEETADQEKEHAKRFFSFLKSGEALEITAMYPAGTTGTTMDNLRAAACGENEEWTKLYPEFARIAREEGFEKIAQAWDAISISEKQHEKRFNGLVANLEAGRVFKREGKVVWYCQNCGYLHEGDEAPEVCPACVHPRAHFSLLAENW